MKDELYLKTPFENNDFFNMVISRTNGKKFQQCIDYDLNVEGYDRTNEFVRLIISNISLFRNNLLKNYEELKDGKFKNIIDIVISKWNLDSIPFEKAFEIYLKNRDYFDKYFNYFHNGWLYLNSEKTNPALQEKIDSSNVQQRLYISIDNDKIDEFAKEFQKILEKDSIPYNYKIQAGVKLRSADSICIYSDSFERTKQYLNILLPLLNKYDESIHKPQPHLGIINDSIGLGFELKNGYSYSEVMEEVSYKAIENSCKNIFEYNQKSRIKDDRINYEYKNGNLIGYIKQRARTNDSMYELLREEFETNFRTIIEKEHPDFDIDMWDITRNLESKKSQAK